MVVAAKAPQKKLVVDAAGGNGKNLFGEPGWCGPSNADRDLYDCRHVASSINGIFLDYCHGEGRNKIITPKTVLPRTADDIKGNRTDKASFIVFLPIHGS